MNITQLIDKFLGSGEWEAPQLSRSTCTRCGRSLTPLVFANHNCGDVVRDYVLVIPHCAEDTRGVRCSNLCKRFRRPLTMPTLKREFFDGKSKFKPNTRSNYHNGEFHPTEWRIERHWKTETKNGFLDTSQRFCDFFGTRKEALIVCKALELVPMLMKKLAKMKVELKTALGNYRETFSQLAQAEDAHEQTKKLLTQAQEETQEKATVIQALMIELRSQKVEMQRGFDQLVKVWTDKDAERVRRIDELEAQLATAAVINNALSFDNRLLATRSVEAEALVGRIVIKRDKRGRR